MSSGFWYCGLTRGKNLPVRSDGERVACKVKSGNTNLYSSHLTLGTYLRCFNWECSYPRFFIRSMESKRLLKICSALPLLHTEPSMIRLPSQMLNLSSWSWITNLGFRNVPLLTVADSWVFYIFLTEGIFFFFFMLYLCSYLSNTEKLSM